jgi:hypothetical protein
MTNKLAIAIFGLAVLYTSPAWAGKTGPGWASRQNPPAQETEAGLNQDRVTAKNCQANEQFMQKGMCKNLKIRHPEMFANSTSAMPH